MKSPAPAGQRRRVVSLALALVAGVGVLAAGLVATGLWRPDPPLAPAPDEQRGASDRRLEDLSRLGGEERAAAEGEGRAQRTPAEAVPAFGMMAWRTNLLGPADFALIARSGARLYRFNLITSTSEGPDPPPNPGVYDRLIRAGVLQGVEFLPVLLRTRRGGSPERPRQVAEPPETETERELWRERVRFYAERYGPDGRFWRENPELPYRPIRAWEVWNEPNLRQFWDRREIDPREYADLLRETRAALRSIDPRARIVSGGLASRYDATTYLQTVLDEVGPCRVDAIGIHPYAPSAEGTIEHLTETRRTADAVGAAGAPLWITEVGWRVGSSSYAGVPNARVQARHYRRLLAEIDRRRLELGLGPTIAFALRDRFDPRRGKVTNRTGLLGPGDRPRPAWQVWTRAARAAPELPLPKARDCG